MILIIDDDSAVRSSLSFMLKRAGYEAQAVPGPREAMEVVRSVVPDLILMDMNFTLSTTGEEGLTLLKQVKIFRPETPVILMTAGEAYSWQCKVCRQELSILSPNLGITRHYCSVLRQLWNWRALSKRQRRSRMKLLTVGISSVAVRG